MKQDLPFPVFGVFTVQEEIGLRGAGVAAYDVAPDLAIVLEGTTCADIPGADEHGQSTRLGHGPAITVMDRTNIPALPIVEQLARRGHRKRDSLAMEAHYLRRHRRGHHPSDPRRRALGHGVGAVPLHPLAVRVHELAGL